MRDSQTTRAIRAILRETNGVLMEGADKAEANERVAATKYVCLILHEGSGDKALTVEILKAAIRVQKPVILFIGTGVDEFDDLIEMANIVHRVEFELHELTEDLLRRETAAFMP